MEQARVSHWLQGNRTVEEDTEDEGDRSRDGEQSADDIDDDDEHSANNFGADGEQSADDSVDDDEHSADNFGADGEQSADDSGDDVEHSADGEDQDDYEQQLLNDDKGAESDWILIGYW